LSVGGTGKTSFVAFLLQNYLEKKETAIIARGYKSSLNLKKYSYIVSDGKGFILDAIKAGDESFMLAKNFPQSVFLIGARRDKSIFLLKKFCKTVKRRIRYVVLDDAYQNYDVRKNKEILLLDARYCLKKQRALPLGRLRERDYLRASCIIFNHVKALNQENLNKLYAQLPLFPREKVFFGNYFFKGIFLDNAGSDRSSFLRGEKALLFSGIADDRSFVDCACKQRIDIVKVIKFVDHHEYVVNDINLLIEGCKRQSCNVIVTTEKDWYKVKNIFKKFKGVFKEKVSWYVLRVTFDFLNREDHKTFKALILSEQ
jgi:tetraacyldisaccharide 4'-kinase